MPRSVLERVGGVLLGLLALVLAARVWRQRTTAQRVDELHRLANTDRDAVVDRDELDGLPDPVQSYLSSALRERQQVVDSVRLEQEGRLRTGDASSRWLSFTATQHVTTDPPGFFWEASVRIAPFCSISVRDLFSDGRGGATVSLFGLVPLDGTGTSPELVEAELMRYLAEAVWYPTALLPSNGVQWEAIDDRTAEATIERGDVSASLKFSFTEDDEVERVYTDGRYRYADGEFVKTPWSGYWRDYEMRAGMSVPMAGDVVWHLPDGDLHAWEGRVTDIQYE